MSYGATLRLMSESVMHKVRIPLAVIALLAVIAWVYWPGLGGPFLLDDEANLSPLAGSTPLTGRQDVLSAVFSNRSGPLHRPLSMASFLVTADAWPSNPWAFKFGNLLIHLLNTWLVYRLARAIFEISGEPSPAACAWLCAVLWGLHPMQLSTVLYVVQRMTELAATFSLVGLLIYLHGRRQPASDPMSGRIWMMLGIGGCGLLATLSKESGALLPLFALCMEATVLVQLPRPPHWRLFSGILLGVPVLGLIAYMLAMFPGIHAAYEARDFSMLQRLMTEGRVLIEYLRQLVVPSFSSASIFHDDWTISRGLLDPLSTLNAGLAILLLVIAALALRRAQPILSLCLLFFFCGHLLESTVIPLELYFEHRNYLPVFGLALAGAFYAARLTARSSIVGGLAIAAYAGLEIWISQYQARIWGNQALAVALWPKEHPDSLRATQYAARYWMARGNLPMAQANIESFAARHPDSSTARLQAIALRCTLGSAEAYATASESTLRNGAVDKAGPDTLLAIQQNLASDQCHDLTSATLLHLVKAYASNPALRRRPDQLGYVYFIEASALADARRFDEAVVRIDEAARIRPTIFAAFWQSHWMLEAGEIEKARQYFASAMTQYRIRFGKNAPLDQEMMSLQNSLR